MSVFKISKNLFVSCLFILLLLAHLGGAQVADPDLPLEEAAPAYCASEAESALKEVLPLVEEITGRKLKQVPQIKLVARDEYMAAVMKGRTQQKSSTTQPRLQTYVDYALGVYEPRANLIYLFPGNFKPRLDRAGVPSSYHEAILKMVVAHELTHSLQRQEIWSGSRRRSRSSSRRYSPMVVRTVTEGHATWVMDRVAERLGVPDAIPQFHNTISTGLVAYTDPNNRKANDEFRKREKSFYLDGKRFIEQQYKNGGNEKVWQILKNPPSRLLK